LGWPHESKVEHESNVAQDGAHGSENNELEAKTGHAVAGKNKTKMRTNRQGFLVISVWSWKKGLMKNRTHTGFCNLYRIDTKNMQYFPDNSF